MTKLTIGLVGQRNAGKTQVADRLVEKFGFEMLGFSDPIYEIVKVFGFTDQQIQNKKFRELPLDLLGGKSLYEFMVAIGDQFGRNMVQEDLWADLLFSRVKTAKSDRIVVQNVRYPNEFEKCRARGAIMIGIETHLPLLSEVPAEVHIPSLLKKCDLLIDNFGYPIDLPEKIDFAVNLAIARSKAS